MFNGPGYEIYNSYSLRIQDKHLRSLYMESWIGFLFNVIRIVLNGSQRVPSKIVQIKLCYYYIDDTKQVYITDTWSEMISNFEVIIVLAKR